MAGRVATTILNHITQVFFLIYPFDLSAQKGQSLGKKSTTTARIAPSWITTRNSSRKDSSNPMFRYFSARIRCPVLLTGSHSVIPSMIPYRIVLIHSIVSPRLFSGICHLPGVRQVP